MHPGLRAYVVEKTVIVYRYRSRLMPLAFATRLIFARFFGAVRYDRDGITAGRIDEGPKRLLAGRGVLFGEVH